MADAEYIYSPVRKVQKFQWHIRFQCQVEVLKTGSFPSSVIVLLPDGREVETDYCELTYPLP